eukprot:6458121-Amphidinium_carterae.1
MVSVLSNKPWKGQESVFQTRSRVLEEHLTEVTRRVVRTTHSGQPSSVWTRGERLYSEVEEVQALRARLECTEHNLRDLARVAEYEHGTAQTILRESREFYSYVDGQARGFGGRNTSRASPC